MAASIVPAGTPAKQTDAAGSDPTGQQPADYAHSFVPSWLASAPAILGGGPLMPAITPLPSAAVFADVSGFSELTQLFADQGAEGIERLTRIIDDFLGRLLDRVVAWGGDVEDLYGDGMLAFWPAEAAAPPPVAPALGCAADIVARFDGFAAAPGVRLRLRAAAVAGDCFALQLGGISDHWLFLLAGNCLGAIGALLDDAQPGQVALGPGVRRLLPEAPALMPAAGLASALRRSGAQPPAQALSKPAVLDREIARLFVPRSLRNRTLGEPGWLAEIRSVSILCAGFQTLRCEAPEQLTAVQQTVVSVQRIVQEHGGAVIRASMSEKGPMIMAAFGVPDSAHPDDPSRALLTAFEIAQTGAPVGARCTVATGTAFCGVVGNAVRLAFTPFGPAVNRAAKLLTVPGLPAVICDEATARSVDHRISRRPLDGSGRIGRERLLLFEPTIAMPAGDPSTPVEVIGRDRELAALSRCVDELTGSEGRGGIVTIEGEAGIGKSSLVDYVLQRVARRALALRCAADPMTGATPLASLSPIFATLFAPEIAVGPDATSAAVGEVLERRGLDPSSAALAGAVLPVARSFEFASMVRDLSPEDAARVQREVLLALLHERIGERGAVVVIEEAHWLDSASWSLLNRAARDLGRVLFVLAARPATETRWQGFDAALDVIPAERLRLLPLGDAEMAAILVRTLNCAQIEQRVLTAITERARGSPMFAVQLALGLRDRGALVVEHGICLLDAAASDDVLRELPDTLQRTIIARFDRLSEPLQLTLKVASVFGRPFSAEALRDVMPLSSLRHAHASILGDLVRAGLLRAARRDVEPGSDFDFIQPVACEAVYGLLPFAQRRDLHDRIARYLELAPEGIPPPDALLGHHWAQAGKPERAIDCWERAGLAALLGGAYREAARAYTEAVQAAERLGLSGPVLGRVTRLRQNLGEALLHSGDLAKSRAQLQHALLLFGRPLGHGLPRAVAALGRHTAALVWREACRRRGVVRAPSARVERHGQLARIYENLGQVLGHTGEVVGMAACVVAALNAAHRSGDDAAYSRTAGLLALVCLLMAWLRTADFYYAHACRTRPGVDRPHDRLMTSEYIAIYLLAAARLSEAEAELRDMIALAIESGNQRRGLDAASLLSLCLIEAGRPAECAPLQLMLADKADQYGDPQLRCWVALEQAQLAFANGPDAAVERHLAMAERLLPRLGVHEAVWTFGLLAALRAMQARLSDALGYARRVTELAARRKIAVYAQHGIFGAAAVSLDALERASGAERHALGAEMRSMIRVLGEFSLRLPLTRPRGLLLLARHAQLCGHRRRAERLLLRAAAAAAAQQRPYQLAVAFPWVSTDPSRR